MVDCRASVDDRALADARKGADNRAVQDRGAGPDRRRASDLRAGSDDVDGRESESVRVSGQLLADRSGTDGHEDVADSAAEQSW